MSHKYEFGPDNVFLWIPYNLAVEKKAIHNKQLCISI